jgi:hypothetical protein
MPKTPKTKKGLKKMNKKVEKIMTDEVEEKFGEWCEDPENRFDEACERLYFPSVEDEDIE